MKNKKIVEAVPANIAPTLLATQAVACLTYSVKLNSNPGKYVCAVCSNLCMLSSNPIS
jgi:hypothetical protein